MSNWLNRPKTTPLQMILYTFGIFYFLFLNTEFFMGLDDFIKFAAFVGIMLLSYLAGYSAIDSKKLGLEIVTIMRNPRKDLATKYEEVFEKIDGILFQVKRQIKKEKQKKKEEKIMEEKNKLAIQMLGWYIIALLIPVLAVIIEWVQTIGLPVSLAALLISLVSASGILINRLIKLYFELSEENPFESP